MLRARRFEDDRFGLQASGAHEQGNYVCWLFGKLIPFDAHRRDETSSAGHFIKFQRQDFPDRPEVCWLELGNSFMHINHDCRPNAEIAFVTLSSTYMAVIKAKEDIEAGVEITIGDGRELFRADCPCKSCRTSRT
ncbi:SET domain-containing protein [Myriangium duriaei CBS 260.36]|uniref:SET domain-containing protein n=1 Tax=Myriangium duriaei CBS 260.36 TaxID=1168546 RepID=A0A9P4IST7_9PEZI|nr:SET domain-containing protein [Myriangium duriaei CBS 260.36]